VAPYRGRVAVDVGTGDGRYVYRSARANPDRFYIGIDADRRALSKVSERVHRRPEQGGLSNVLFVQAPVEGLPAELDGIADQIHVHFPWGSLLQAVATGERDVLLGLGRIAAPGAWLEVVFSIDEGRDAAELRRLGLPPLTEEYLESTLGSRYARAGWEVGERGVLPPSEWPFLETTWAKRLGAGDRGRMMFLVARGAARGQAPPPARGWRWRIVRHRRERSGAALAPCWEGEGKGPVAQTAGAVRPNHTG
jgi:16S rRNA (adenine(1408)-N(1))-methyltransferase